MTTKNNAMKVMQILENEGFTSFLAGGGVRDTLLDLPVHDYDITTSATPDQVAKIFPGSKFVGENFGVSLVKMNGDEFETATFRLDGSYSDSRRPDSVKFTNDPKEDVLRRDFSINALLMDKNGKVFDFVGGLDDLNNKVVRTVGNPKNRFKEDALRLLRAVRFAARLGFTIESETKAAITEFASSVKTLPADRIAGELSKILTGGNVDVAFKLFDETGILQYVLPDFCRMRGVDQNEKWHPEGNVWNHTLKMLSFLKPNCSLTLALGVLFHDVGKPVTAKRNPSTGHNQFFGHEHVGAKMTKNTLRDLRFSNEVVDTVTDLVANHMRFFNTSHMNVSKLKRFVRSDNFSELLELNKFDSLGSNGNLTDHDFCKNFLESMAPEELRPERLLTGNDLIEMGMKPGPNFKILLEAVETAQLDGVITTKEQAVALVQIKIWFER